MPSKLTPVVPLSRAPGKRESWDRPKWFVYLWGVVEPLVLFNAFQPSSRLRVAALRMFGASIGDGVVFRPRTRVRFPWKLHLGDNCWVGEGVWFHNQDHVYVGHDVVISQETLLTTGTHGVRTDMGLRTRPIQIEPGAWVAARCVVLGGSHVGISAVIAPNTVVRGEVPAEVIWGAAPAGPIGRRFGGAAEAG